MRRPGELSAKREHESVLRAKRSLQAALIERRKRGHSRERLALALIRLGWDPREFAL